MRGPQPAGSVLAVFDLTPPGRLTLDEAREAATVLRLQAAEFAEHVLPIYNRMSPNIDSLKKIINATKLFAVGHLSAAQLNDTTVAVRDERFGGANGEVLASVLSAALLEQKGAVAEDVAWFCAYLAAYCARTAAAEAGEWTPEFEAYVGESLAVSVLTQNSTAEEQRTAQKEVLDHHDGGELSATARKRREEAERAELEWQRHSFNTYVLGFFA